LAETKVESTTAEQPRSQVQSPSKNQSLQSGRNESDINFAIKSLQEETQQIFELIEMERTYGSEVSTQLKQIIMPLNLSYHIKPESISKTDSSISDVVLTPQGMVCVFNNQGSMISRPLESFQSDVLIRILLEVIPEIKVMLNEKRQKMSGRVMTLERVAKELRKVPALVPPTKGAPPRTSSSSQSANADSQDRASSQSSSSSVSIPNTDALKSAIGEKQ
jgi:hypothetical protein